MHKLHFTNFLVVLAFTCSLLIVNTIPILNAQETNDTLTSTEEAPPPEYIYNPETGLWDNGIYTWDPGTGKTSPLKEVDYSYNPETQHWDTSVWVYDKGSQTYVKKDSLVTNTQILNDPSITPKQSSMLEQAPNEDTEPLETQPNTPKHIDDNYKPEENSSKTRSGLFFDNYFDASISISVNSFATTGNASVLNNTLAGNASTGDALAYASILNLLQSSWSANGFSPNIFSTNVFEDYFGDISIDPGMLKVKDAPVVGDLEIKNVETAAIQNNINLNATSGNALVSNNTIAGNATTGDAYAIAQIINLINSSIAAQQSFIGTINVFGNMEGDILLPENLKKQLLNSNIPTTNIKLSGEVSVNNNSDISIDNNLNLISQSGSAMVENNNTAGSATSGNASTEVTVFNLIGNRINYESGLLVFVNVSGEWIGFITGAGVGENTALLGNAYPNYILNDTNIDVERLYAIENNIALTSKTGDAEVSRNTVGGNAESGNAYAKANLLNIVNSNLNFTSWFGALFINIFGNWSGSFGTDTVYGGYSTLGNINSGGIGGDNHSKNVQDNAAYFDSADTSENVVVFEIFKNSSGEFVAGRIIDNQPIAENEEDKTNAAVASISDNNYVGPFIDDEAVSSNGILRLFWQTAVVSVCLIILWRIYLNNRSQNELAN